MEIKQKKTAVSFTIDESNLERLKDEQIKYGQSVSAIANYILTEYFKEKKHESK